METETKTTNKTVTFKRIKFHKRSRLGNCSTIKVYAKSTENTDLECLNKQLLFWVDQSKMRTQNNEKLKLKLKLKLKCIALQNNHVISSISTNLLVIFSSFFFLQINMYNKNMLFFLVNGKCNSIFR